jgi:hypothetical protein
MQSTVWKEQYASIPDEVPTWDKFKVSKLQDQFFFIESNIKNMQEKLTTIPDDTCLALSHSQAIRNMILPPQFFLEGNITLLEAF